MTQSDVFCVRLIFLILKIVLDCRWGSYLFIWLITHVVGQNSCSYSMCDKIGMCVPLAELFLLFFALVCWERSWQQGQCCCSCGSIEVWWRVLWDLPDPPGAPATSAQGRPSTRPIRDSQLWQDGALIILPDVCLGLNDLGRVCQGPRDGWAVWFLSTLIS